MKIVRNGVEYELTSGELEQAYRERKHYYLLCDAECQFIDYCRMTFYGNADRFTAIFGFTPEDVYDENSQHYLLEKFVAAFENHHDCECDENSMWQEVIRNVLIANAAKFEVTYDATYDLYPLGMSKLTSLHPSYPSLEKLHEAAPAYICAALQRHGICSGKVLVRTTVKKVKHIGSVAAAKETVLTDYEYVELCRDRLAVVANGKLQFVEE